MELRSDQIKRGVARAPHRSLLKADGITDEEMDRPFIAVLSSRNDVIPGHTHLDKIAEAVKAGIYMAGGVPFEISTIGVCDGIAMNHEGMHYSLVSREVIADSVECAVMGHAFDGLVCIPNCDKIVPGMILGALRANVPTVFVSGGPMLPGTGPDGEGSTDLNTLFDGAGKVAAGTMTEEELAYFEDTACPTCGSCSGMFTANSMNCLCEALGIALPGNGTVPAVYSERIRLAKRAGMKVMELLRDNVRIKDILNAAAVRNAMECDMAFGGSTNTVLHLTAIANAAGCPITMADWDAASARTPHLVKLAPSGPRPLIDLYRAGGVPAVMGELGRLGLLDESALTCMGPLPEYLARCCPPADGEVCRTGENPYSAQGALKVLYGNLAPDGSVVKKAAVDPSMLCHTGPARVFDSEEAACAAINGGAIAPGDVVVIRYEGPAGGPGMRPDHRRALLRRHQGAGRGAREPRGGGRRPHRPHLRGRFRHRGHRGRRADAERERRGARAPARGVGATGAQARCGRVGQVRETGNFCRQGGDHPVSDINDSTAAASAATPAEGKPTTPVRRNAATQGAPRGAGSRTAKQGRTMLGAEAVVASLEAEGVTTVFGYPGGQAIKLYDALYDSDQITHVLARHEQGAVHMADGYARSTGRAGVAIVTSGPGATNTVTGIATAYMDSVPLVVITGQVGRGVIGTDSFQESDIVGITMPVVKHSYLLQSTDELTRTIREAFHIAVTGRPGPVLIDIPSDVAGETMVFEYPDAVNLPSYKPTYRGNAKQIRAACRLLEEAEQPLLYVGGGVISSEATDEIVALMDKMRIPSVVTLMGKGGVPASHPLNLGPVGMHGAKYSNMAMTEADLIIAAGARFSDRVTGRVTEFAPNAKIVHIDIDPAEIGKIRDADVPIVGDLKGIIAGMLEVLEKDGAAPRDDQWIADIDAWRARYPFYHPNMAENEESDEIVPELAIAELGRQLDPAASIVTTEVGQHQMWAHQFLPREFPRTFLSSGGLGTMGFGFPAAIGAAVANPDATVVCIAGDGSFQMNSQEMATAAINGVPVKVMILDNRCLGMVHQWQKLFYDKRYSQTLLAPVPDFVKLAEAYGWEGERVEAPGEVTAAIERMLAAEGPYLLDVAISPEQNVYPMVAPGAALGDVMGAIDVAVGAVRTDVPAAPGSLRARAAAAGAAAATSPCAKLDAQFGGRWEIDPEDTGARLGQDGSTVDVRPEDWKTLFRDGDEEKGGAR